MDEVKTCSKCGETKPCAEFSNSSASKDGLKSQCKACAKEYQELNKEALATKAAKYHLDNREAIIARKNSHYQDNKEAATLYYEQNKETITAYKAEHYQINRETILAYNAEYQKTPKGKLSAKNAKHKRRALIKDGSVTTEALQELIAGSSQCFYCDCGITDDNRNIDHYIPLAKGGLHDINNLVIACCTCNQKKNAKMPGVFIASLPEADQNRIALS